LFAALSSNGMFISWLTDQMLMTVIVGCGKEYVVYGGLTILILGQVIIYFMSMINVFSFKGLVILVRALRQPWSL
jgi:hypothetical protein